MLHTAAVVQLVHPPSQVPPGQIHSFLVDETDLGTSLPRFRAGGIFMSSRFFRDLVRPKCHELMMINEAILRDIVLLEHFAIQIQGLGDVQIQVAIHSAQSTKRTLRVLGHFKKDVKIMLKLRLVASSICFKVMRPCPSTSICLNWLSLAHQTEGKATMQWRYTNFVESQIAVSNAFAWCTKKNMENGMEAYGSHVSSFANSMSGMIGRVDS